MPQHEERGAHAAVRMRRRARIVLLAAAGIATREISRQLGCTIGTASKWRVRYARERSPACPKSATVVPCQSMTPNIVSASWQCSTAAARRLRQLDGDPAGA